jgi:uncharacterized membrane-anchored protein
MKLKLALAAVLLQLLILAYMAGEREWVVLAGRTIYLRTAPVDPHDVMRGDYVRLNYEISRVPQSLCHGALATTNLANAESVPRDLRVYAQLIENEGGVATLTALTDVHPRDGLFIRGRTDRSWWGGGNVSVRYGLEAYFMQQGKALELEQTRQPDGIQVPLEMEVKVNTHGLAVLKSHRWCALGTGLNLEMEPNPQTNRPAARRLVGATVRLMNASSNEVAIVDLPGGGSLALVPDAMWGVEKWESNLADEPTPNPGTTNVVVLKPGAIHTMHINFRETRWAVRATDGKASGNTRLLMDLTNDSSARFRFEYRPPGRAACAGLPHGDTIWHGRLATRAFSPAGSID